MARRQASSGVRVVGLDELVRDLKRLDPEHAKDLRKTNKTVASKVADHARGRAQSLGGVAAKSAPSLRASAGAGYAGVSLGGGAHPYALGAEFGAVRYKQFKPWRGNGSDAGYFLYPTIRDDGPEIEQTYSDDLGDLLNRLGLT